MKFTTASGSVYEVNTDSKQIRRLNGVKDPTPRQGPDGQWRTYKDLLLAKGESALIVWGDDTELLSESKEILKEGGFAIPTTMTSTVMEIEQ